MQATTEPDSGIAMTRPLRMVHASATAVAEQTYAAPIRASVGSRSRLAPRPNLWAYMLTEQAYYMSAWWRETVVKCRSDHYQAFSAAQQR
jgi:hypothetical protein